MSVNKIPDLGKFPDCCALKERGRCTWQRSFIRLIYKHLTKTAKINEKVSLMKVNLLRIYLLEISKVITCKNKGGKIDELSK